MIKSEDFADEKYELNPISLYAKSKVRIEKFIENNKRGWGYWIWKSYINNKIVNI